jgi:hypothetical protein
MALPYFIVKQFAGAFACDSGLCFLPMFFLNLKIFAESTAIATSSVPNYEKAIESSLYLGMSVKTFS